MPARRLCVLPDRRQKACVSPLDPQGERHAAKDLGDTDVVGRSRRLQYDERLRTGRRARWRKDSGKSYALRRITAQPPAARAVLHEARGLAAR